MSRLLFWSNFLQYALSAIVSMKRIHFLSYLRFIDFEYCAVLIALEFLRETDQISCWVFVFVLLFGLSSILVNIVFLDNIVNCFEVSFKVLKLLLKDIYDMVNNLLKLNLSFCNSASRLLNVGSHRRQN